MSLRDHAAAPGQIVPFEPWRHRFAVGVCGATVVLLIAGGLVTSTGSGLAVPDWPLSFGRVFPPMIGGVLFEHGHRLVAAGVGLLTMVLAGWCLRRETRGWVRWMAGLAAGAVLAQGILGGLTVLLRLPTSVSVAHACLAQGFFCLTVVLALATSRTFVEGVPARPAEEGAPPLWVIGAAATAATYAQLILGAVMRHTGAGLAIPDVPLAFGRLVPPFLSFEIAIHFAHRVGALAVLALVAWMAARALRKSGRPDLTRTALLAGVLVVIQILLGALSVLTRLAVIPATAHVVTGAALLAACLVLTVRAARGTVRRPRAVAELHAAGRAA